MKQGHESSHQIVGIDILYNTVFNILSETEFKGLPTKEVKEKL